MATYEQFRNMLRTDRLRLDDELEVHAETRQHIAEEVARLNTRMLQAYDDLKVAEASAYEDLKEGSERMTEAQIKAKVSRDPDRRKRFAVYQELRETYERWKDLLESWDTKGFKLKDLGALYASDYFSIQTVYRNADERPRREINEAGRAALREASRKLDEPEAGPRGRVKL